MRFERYSVIERKLQNICFEHEIHDDYKIDKVICDFNNLTRDYFIDSNIHSYDQEGYDLFEYGTVIGLFNSYLKGEKEEIELVLELLNPFKPLTVIDNILFDTLGFEDNDYRTNEKLVSLFHTMVLDKADRFCIEVKENAIGTKLYNESKTLEMFDYFMDRIYEYKIDINEIY